MSLLNYLQPQKIDDNADEFYEGRMVDDDIALDDQIDEASLENYWDKVVKDIENDPEWFTFDSK